MLYCIACHGDLPASSSNSRVCSGCGKQYPCIDGVDVFLVPDAMASLLGYAGEIDHTRAEFAALDDSLALFEKSGDKGLSERSARHRRGMAANLKVLDAVYRPIVEFVESRPCPVGVAGHNLRSGYTGDHMLTYFYQDWCGVADYEAVKNLISQSVATHCGDRESVAVLGAGACGLLHSVSAYFQVAYGVDLSLSALLMAKKLIAGTPLVFQLKDADWREVRVAPPAPSSGNIEFLVADAMTLPFKDSSLSVVITQYLLDIVSNAGLFAQEIRRVLKPGGVWINFSKPFKVYKPAALSRYRLAELPCYFGKRGFAVEEMACRRFVPLNLEALDGETDNVSDVVHFFALRKTGQALQVAEDRPVSRFFVKNDAVWREVPRIISGREVDFLQKRPVGGELRDESLWLNVMGNFIAVPANLGLLLESLFALINGERDLKDLFLILRNQGLSFSEEQFLALIYRLHREYALIDLQDGDADFTSDR